MLLWESSAFWGIIGLLGGIIATIASSIIAKGRKKLAYRINQTTLIHWQISRLSSHTVALDGIPVESLYMTTVNFSNTGNQTIESSDFSETIPLTITAASRFFAFDLDRKDAIASTLLEPRMHLEQVSENSLNITFDYIKPRETFDVTLLHDGNLLISGDIKSGKIKKEKLFIRPTLVIIVVILLFAIIMVWISFLIVL